jgi:glycolate oxidase iron-sulfur subunit
MGESVNAAVDPAHIAALADQCVKCGLCLPHCPTYRVGRIESESPRGRIAFAQALATGQIEATPALSAHLDQCLACLHCERVCPSHVRYGELIVATRALLRETARPPRSPLGFLTTHPRWLRAALRVANAPIVRNVRRSRALQALLRPLRLDRLARELPRLPRVGAWTTQKIAASRGRVGLFLGCVASAADRDVHASAMRLLHALGYEVVLPADQGCCGALALHAGDINGADALGTNLHDAFVGVETVLVSASGCFGTLRDHVFLRGTARVCEIHEFLDADAEVSDLRFRSLPARAALHTPCTQKNVAHAQNAIARLLGRIPQLEIAALPEQSGCCGAAGDYFLKHASIADALRAETLEQVQSLRPDLLVTSNVGCRIFLDNGLHQAGARIPVTHPVVLLAQQLEN